MLRNVTIYDRNTGKIINEVEEMPDRKEEIKAFLIKHIGHGSYRLRWFAREKGKDGKMASFPRQMVVYALKPLSAGQAAPEPAGAMTAPTAAAYVRETMPGEAPFLVQLILQRIDSHMQEIKDRISAIMVRLDEEESEDLSGFPEGTEDGEEPSFGSVIKSVIADPQYSGLVGGLMAGAANPEIFVQTLQSEIDKNPQLISGLLVKFVPLVMAQVGE